MSVLLYILLMFNVVNNSVIALMDCLTCLYSLGTAKSSIKYLFLFKCVHW